MFHKFAVIGSNCFTGSHFVDALLKDPKNRVIGVSRSPENSPLYLPYRSGAAENFRFHRGDLVRDPAGVLAGLDAFEPEVVIQAAALSEVALSHERPAEYFLTNTLGTVHLAGALRARPYLKRYVHISSAEIYGSCERPLPESAPLNPTTPYAVSKAAADLFLLSLAKNFGFPVTLIRSTNVYGKHQQLFKIVPRAVIFLRRGQKIELHGGGRAVKSFVHVRDVVRGALKTLDLARPDEVYHFSTDASDTVAQVVEKVCRLMGKDPTAHTVAVGERLGQDARYRLDCARASAELGWRPQVPFEEGLREVIAWIEANWAAVQKEPLAYVHRS